MRKNAFPNPVQIGMFADYNWDNEAKLLSMTVPVSYVNYAYSYDAMGRPSGLTEAGTTTLVSGVQYNAAHQPTQMTYEGWTETRQYNDLGQLRRLTIPGVVDFEYRYSATQNNGRITQQKDWVTGEEVSYTYDSLNRLITGVTTGPEWGLTFGYDGFGNKTSQTVTKGNAPALSLGIDAATNRVTGANYDANGNQQPSAATNHYDWENRLLYNGTESYFYDFQNRRVYKHTPAGGMQWTFYGIDGRRLVTARWDWVAPPYTVLTEMSRNIYFAGKLIRTGGDSVVRDRLGSVRYRKNGGVTERLDYFPYGEEKPGATAQAREKFATYYRDGTGLDYADQRYFTSQWGRFMSAAETVLGNGYTFGDGDPVMPPGESPGIPCGSSMPVHPVVACQSCATPTPHMPATRRVPSPADSPADGIPSSGSFERNPILAPVDIDTELVTELSQPSETAASSPLSSVSDPIGVVVVGNLSPITPSPPSTGDSNSGSALLEISNHCRNLDRLRTYYIYAFGLAAISCRHGHAIGCYGAGVFLSGYWAATYDWERSGCTHVLIAHGGNQ